MTAWIDDQEAESRCWVYLHTTGGTRRCVIRPDNHDGAHEYETRVTPIGPRPQDCEHEPDPRGVKCAHCGIPAEMVTPDELADALYAAIVDCELRIAGQVGMFDGA